jgi:hypothetical protein
MGSGSSIFAEKEQRRRGLKAFVSQLEPFPSDRFQGTGIVICAGGSAIFTNAYVLVHVLRHELKCQMPIEIWHFGVGELSERMQFLLRELDAEPVDASEIIKAKAPEIVDGWQLKSLALMWSRFAHVLLLDADQVPERDPAAVFEWSEYLQSGAVLWPDICALTEENEIWEACDLPRKEMRSIESGQLVIDKSRHWNSLQIALFLNQHADYYYQLVYGDKDLFLMAFLLSGNSFTIVPHPPFSDNPWCLFQRDFAGERLFQHRTGAKWRYTEPQAEVPGFHHGDACRVALLSLRKKWNGHVFLPPERSSIAKREENRLTEIGHFAMAMPGGSRKTIELLSFNEMGLGRDVTISNWFCEEGDAIQLILCDPFGERFRFRKSAQGRWFDAANEDAPIFLLEDAMVEVPSRIDSALRSTWDAAGRYTFKGY